MSSAAVTVNNPVQSSTYQPRQQQRQTAKDVIAENVKALIAQLEAGKSDALTAYLDAMARFHNYSFGKHSGHCASEADRNQRSRNVHMEPAWTPREERREGHPDTCTHDRHSPQEAGGGRTGWNWKERPCFGWFSRRLRLRFFAN